MRELAESRVGVSVLCPGVVKSNLEKGLADAPAAMDPLEVGVRLLEGIGSNDLYVLTHPEFGPIIRDRSRLIERSINSLASARGTAVDCEPVLSQHRFTQALARSDC